MTSHIGVMTVFVVCVATVFATLMREEPQDQFWFGLRVVLALTCGAFVLGWAMYWAFP